LDKRRIIELRGRAQSLPATVRIGKDGITQTVIDEVIRQLKKTKLVKVKLLPSVEKDRKEAGAELAKVTSSVLIEVRGRTVVLASE
jgi:RNA-binding protein